MLINNNYQNQSFGSLKIGKSTMELITKRLKSDAELKELETLFAGQMKNKHDVFIFNHKDSKFLSGRIGTSKGSKEIYEESDLGIFSSPLNFIKSLCRQATYQSESDKFAKNFSFLK